MSLKTPYKWKRVARLGLCVGALLVYGLSAVMFSSDRHRILIQAASPVAFEPPFRVEVLTEDGDRGIRIPEGVGRGWRGEAGGSATYTFYIPSDDSYTLWAYCLWSNVCTNAVYAQLDGLEKYVLGNDAVFNAWHWVRGVGTTLDRGTHRLILSNHSDGIAIQRMMLLSDPLDHPVRDALVSYDLFYDGFDGCDGGNFTSWHLTHGGWRLAEPLGEGRFEQRVLAGDAEAEAESDRAIWAAVGEDTWQNCGIAVSVRVLRPGVLGICLNWRSPDDYIGVHWRIPRAADAMEEAAVEIVRVIGRKRTLLTSLRTPFPLDRWQQVGVSVRKDELILAMNGSIIGTATLDSSRRGEVALMLAEGAQAWFDDIHVRRSESWGAKRD